MRTGFLLPIMLLLAAGCGKGTDQADGAGSSAVRLQSQDISGTYRLTGAGCVDGSGVLLATATLDITSLSESITLKGAQLTITHASASCVATDYATASVNPGLSGDDGQLILTGRFTATSRNTSCAFAASLTATDGNGLGSATLSFTSTPGTRSDSAELTYRWDAEAKELKITDPRLTALTGTGSSCFLIYTQS